MEAGTQQEQWRIIEDVYEPDELLNEIPPSHFLAGELIGKRVGDSFLLSPSGIATRTAVIKQVLSKYVYRYQDCLASWQIRFPAIPALEMLRITQREEQGGVNEADFSAVFSLLDRKEEAIARALKAYESMSLPLQALGKALGQSVFAVVLGLAATSNAGIKCCVGSAPERTQALEALRVTNGVVLDLTAIATISTLDIFEIFDKYGTPLIVSRTALLELEQLETEEISDSGKLGSLGKQDGRYFIAEKTDEERHNRIKHIHNLTNAIKKSCRVLTCPDLAACEPERRQALVRAFGQHGAESILLASEPGRILWTDDYILADLAQKEFGVHRVWTQLFLQMLAESGVIDPQIVFDASAKLIGYGYYFTSLNLPALMAAHRLADGNPDKWPLQQALKAFADEAVSPEDSLSLLTQYVVEIFGEKVFGSQEFILIRILEHLGTRKEGIRMIQALRKILPVAMGLNVLRAQAAEAIIVKWLSYRRP